MSQRLENDELFKVVKNFHEAESVPDVCVQHSDLIPRLRPYQEKAVQWMIHRERTVIKDSFLKLDDEASTSGENKDSLFVSEIQPGGILSDEMGLGKTVEVLACLLNNPRLGVDIPKGNVSGDSEEDEEDTYKPYFKQTATQRKKEREIRAQRRAMEKGVVDEEMDQKPIPKKAKKRRKELDKSSEMNEENEEEAAKVTSTIVEGTDKKEGVGISDETVTLKPENVAVKEEHVETEETMNTPKSYPHALALSLAEDPANTSDGLVLNSQAKNSRGKKTKRLGKRAKKGDAGVDCEAPQPAKKKSTPSLMKQSAMAWYESKLSEVDRNPIRAFYESMAESQRSSRNIVVQCVCGETDEIQLLKCKSCARWLHKKCIGALSWEGSKPIFCPQCWLKQSPIESRATLIVSPKSISGQWLSEVKKHIIKKSNFKVLVYNGVKIDGFLQPYHYSDYDLILTTYDVLRSELDLAEAHERRSLRHEKRYFSPTCPLLCVGFWRICLDEAQMVEGHATKAADMVSRLTSVHRWAVTGTPIQKSLQDLYGLVKFLCVEPFSDLPSWNHELLSPYCNGDKRPLFTLIAHILWRSSKADVLDQIQIPPQTELLWWQNFSPVEEHFYLRTHQECSNDFLERLSKYDSLNLTLESLRVIDVNYILAPLLKLRQACSHPQAVRGNVITTQKTTMTMTELLESLIKKTTMEAQDALRKHIASLNGMAGLHVLSNEFVSAVEKYREVLRITEDYKERVKVDTLQSIHTMHNLAEIIEEHKDIIAPTLRDDQLRDEAKKLQEKYLLKAQTAVSSVQESLMELTASVQELEQKMSEKEDNDWWVTLCSILDREEMLSRVHDALVNHRKSLPDISCTSIINKVSTVGGLQVTCYQWIENLEKNQKMVRDALAALKTADNEALVNSAVDCHLRISNLKSKTTKAYCQLCSCENKLKKYEMDLFDIKSKKNENMMVGDVYLLGQGKEGSWKPSEAETVLKTLLSLGRHRKVDKELLRCGSSFMKTMDALRKEFKPLRLLWSRINERTCAEDELNMCKLRLRLRYPDEPVPGSSPHVNKRKKQTHNLGSNLDTKMENLHVIEPHQIEQMFHQNQLEAISALSELKKKSGTVAYLQNLRSRGDDSKANVEVCPVCRSTLENKWAVLSCGHCYCIDCMSELFKKNVVHCAVCRETTGFNEVSFVNFNTNREEASSSDATSNLVIPSVQGSHSTKVEAIVRRIFYLRAADPLVKVLIFSTWDRVLDVLEEALGQNGVNHLRLKPGAKYERTLEKFKNVEDEDTVTALLLLVKFGSKGLNLTEATHVLMVEPLLNPSEELQAIGRVHRIGQTRPTYVHRFLIKDTIEDRMFSAVQATGKEKWIGKQVSLQQLKNLFTATPALVPQSAQSENCGSASVQEVTLDSGSSDAE